jgi:hypothetical protein
LMVVIVFLYLFSNIFMVGLRTLFAFARATHNFDKLRDCIYTKPRVLDLAKLDLEFSAKSKSMLLRERLPKG